MDAFFLVCVSVIIIILEMFWVGLTEGGAEGFDLTASVERVGQ